MQLNLELALAHSMQNNVTTNAVITLTLTYRGYQCTSNRKQVNS